MPELSTLRCVRVGCDAGYHADVAMWHVVDNARDLGWVVIDDEHTFCPEHARDEAGNETEVWLVGCFTCDYEEEVDSEEDARWASREHECEAETYIRSPSELREKKLRQDAYVERRNKEHHQKEEQIRVATERAHARQQRLEKYASNWLRVRNTLMFW